MSKILITGATGFIGTHLVKLLQGHHEIIILDRRRPNISFENKIEWLEIDLCDPLDFSNLPDTADVIIHLAQSMHYRQFPEKAEDIFDVNIKGTFNLLQYAKHVKVESFIFASTGGVYGYGSKRFAETDPVNPRNFYGISKLASELLIRAYEPFFRSVIFRFFFVYGPGQQKMLIPGIWKKVKTGKLLTIKGKSGLCINPIYVGDAVRAIEAALEPSVSGIFNVAGDEIVSIRELIGRVEEVVGKKASVQHMENDEPGDLVGDNTRMKELLNVRPQTPLHEGLRMIMKEKYNNISGLKILPV